MVRTEEGKRLRKKYETHKIKHGFNEYRVPEPRKDGLCNTISTVQKDTLVLEQMRIRAIDEQNMKVRDKTFGTIQTDGSSPKHNNRVLEERDMEIQRVGQITDSVDNYRIRKLTPREVFRLMDFTDEQFEAAEEVSSNTALYKAAGNSIIVNCLVAILGQMIEGRENYYRNVDNVGENVDNG